VTAVEVAPDHTAPGVYELDDAAYFGGPLARASLSSTGVRELLNCPAKFRYRQQHARPDKRTFDLGHAAHQLVLGAGPELVLFPGTGANPEAWQKADDKIAVAALRAEGKVPLRRSDWDVVHGMAEALQEHPHAPRLLTRGEPERTLVWRDDATGALCRAKADWLRPDGIVDYKTCDLAELEALRKGVYNFGYYIQAAFYLRGFRARSLAGVEPFFGFIAQEKEAPYLVQTFQLTERALAYGDRKCAEALETYARCVEADEWPGYPTDDIPEIDLPAWVRTEEW
jgi:hypothetical protein